MDLDLETAHRQGKSRFDRRLAALVGAAAITASLLATLEMCSGKREERAFTMASRLAVQVSSGVAVTGLHGSLQASALTQAAALGLESTTRQLAEIDGPSERLAAALGAVDERASQRLFAMAQVLAQDPAATTGLDPVTRDALAADHLELTRLVEEQNRQVDLAERYGSRENAAIFALALLAIAAVLLGLAGIIGEGRQGTRILLVASVVLTASIVWGGSALLR